MFKSFASLVHAQYQAMSANELFTTVDGDTLWAAYLAAFPEGTDPIYKVNTEHTCSCCRNFIRNLGNTVAVVNGKLQSVWSIEDAPYPYDWVAAKMDELVLSAPITDLFRSKETIYGAEVTKLWVEGSTVINWNHFYGNVENKHFTRQADKIKGDYRTSVQVFKRGLEELASSAVMQVVELITSNALYRGEEHLRAVRNFQRAQDAYLSLPLGSVERDTFAWTQAASSASRFRNTVIGTFVQDLSEGKDLEHAVHSFEVKVAPTNYKRTTALVTQIMVKSAMKTVAELGLEDALSRRYAVIGDVSVNNVLWVNSAVKPAMANGLESLLSSVAASTKPQAKTDISIQEFMDTVLPTAKTVEILFANKFKGNLVSLTAPTYPDSGKLFKWDNQFGWSYNGNITDSIKEKVKAAGGRVEGLKLRVSLSWFNFDDLDLSAVTPTGQRIDFRCKAGVLDVDMNAGCGTSREPVENLAWKTLTDGKYEVIVNQYTQRESSDVGYTLEAEVNGNLYQWSYNKTVKGMNTALTIVVQNKEVLAITPADFLTGGSITQEVWGIATETFIPVDTVMYSPNYWDDNATGNKHWFFMLNNCKNPDQTVGIYNEFLSPALTEHRKVFEVLSERTKCPATDKQISGLGFSSTKKETVVTRVNTGKSTRTYSITF